MTTTVHDNPIKGPYCINCNVQMTPENSHLRPELFYCDKCLPAGYRPRGVAESLRPVVEGLVLRVSGTDIIAHARRKAKFYVDQENLERKRQAEWEDERKRREEARKAAPKNSPASHLHGMTEAPDLRSMVNFTAGLQEAGYTGYRKALFMFVCDHTNADADYMLDMEDLHRLEWFV